MRNADKFKEIFGIYVTELFAKSDKEFLEWLIADVPDTNVGDMISRQALMTEFADFVKRSNNSDFAPTPTWNDAVSLVGSMPSAEPRWIPCSERLPERGVSVLVSHVGYVSEDYLDIDDSVMYFWNSEIDLDEELKNLAWMPLPKPWKGVRNEVD